MSKREKALVTAEAEKTRKREKDFQICEILYQWIIQFRFSEVFDFFLKSENAERVTRKLFYFL